MESALLLRQQVIGLKRPSRQSGWKEAGLPGYAIIQHSCNLKEGSRLSGAPVRFVVSQQRPDDPCVLIRYCNTRLGRSELLLLLCNPLTARIILLTRPEDNRS